jgi:hypothetical protein
MSEFVKSPCPGGLVMNDVGVGASTALTGSQGDDILRDAGRGAARP